MFSLRDPRAASSSGDWKQVEHEPAGSDKGKVSMLSAQEAALQEENARLRQQVAALQEMSSTTSVDTEGTEHTRAELEAVQKEIEDLKHALVDADVLDAATMSGGQVLKQSQKMHSLKKKVKTVNKGLDLCFLVDCTGSMDWYIDLVKAKVRGIINTICEMHSNAVINVAFVGYRDFDAAQRFEVFDFTHCSDLDAFQTFLNGIRADGGDDGCEDVAGGLAALLQLSWRSSTRLVIHFCDYPAHGAAYYDKDPYDLWRAGDPEGKRLEDLVQQLCNRRISFYFAAITGLTAKMVRVMQECYVHSHNAEFKVMEWRDAETSFAPLIINSVRSSLQRSAHFKDTMDSAEKKLSICNSPRTMFHSAIG